MVEEMRNKVEQEMTSIIEDLDKNYLRKMQLEMHNCAAKCCENNSLSVTALHSCVDSCSTKLNNAQTYVQNELQHVQNKLQRCVMDCNDNIRYEMGPNPEEKDVSKYTSKFESCAVKCVDDHINLLPSFMKSVRQALSKMSK